MVNAVVQSQVRTRLFCNARLLFCANKFQQITERIFLRIFGDDFNCLSSITGENCRAAFEVALHKSHFHLFKVNFSLKKKGKKGRMLPRIIMFAKITSNPLLLRLIERKACNLIFRVNAHKHWRPLPYDYINSASKSKVLFAKLNENGEKKNNGMYHEGLFYRSRSSASGVFDGRLFTKMRIQWGETETAVTLPFKSGLRLRVFQD